MEQTSCGEFCDVWLYALSLIRALTPKRVILESDISMPRIWHMAVRHPCRQLPRTYAVRTGSAWDRILQAGAGGVNQFGGSGD